MPVISDLLYIYLAWWEGWNLKVFQQIPFEGVVQWFGVVSISLLCWFLLTGVFGSGNTKHSSFFTACLGVYTFSLFFNLLADALHNTGVNDLDSRSFDSVQCLANWKKKSLDKAHWRRRKVNFFTTCLNHLQITLYHFY